MNKNSRITEARREKLEARRERKRQDQLVTIARKNTRANYSRNGGRF